MPDDIEHGPGSNPEDQLSDEQRQEKRDFVKDLGISEKLNEARSIRQDQLSPEQVQAIRSILQANTTDLNLRPGQELGAFLKMVELCTTEENSLFFQTSNESIQQWSDLLDEINSGIVLHEKDTEKKDTGPARLFEPKEVELSETTIVRIINQLQNIKDFKGGNTAESRDRVVAQMQEALRRLKTSEKVTDGANSQVEGIPVDGAIEILLRQVYGERYFEASVDQFSYRNLPTQPRRVQRALKGSIGKIIRSLDSKEHQTGKNAAYLRGVATLISHSGRYYDIDRPTSPKDPDATNYHEANAWRINMVARQLWEEAGSPPDKGPDDPEFQEKARDVFTQRREVFLKTGETPPPPPTPTPVPKTPEITPDQRRAAGKLAEEMIAQMEREEQERLITRGLDRAGFFGSLFFGGRVRRTVEQEKKFKITPELRKMIYEYALSQITGNMTTRSGQEVFRLMDDYGFRVGPNGFEPPHPQSGWSRLFNRGKAGAATFVGGAALGAGTRAGLTTLFGGLGGAVGGGAIVGGVFGFLRGRREGRESIYSGEAWLNDINAALASGNEAKIELACHKVERLMSDQASQREFFQNRTRMEAAKLLDRYREGIRRLSLKRMAEEVTSAEFRGTEEERQKFLATRYAEYCRNMADNGEERFMAEFGANYSNAMTNEINIISPTSQNVLNADDTRSRELVQSGWNREVGRTDLGLWERIFGGRNLGEKQRQFRRIVSRSAVVGALTGGVIGGAGWYVGHLLGGFAGGQGTEHSAAASGSAPDQSTVGHFANEYTMPQQHFQPLPTGEYAGVMQEAANRGLYFQTTDGQIYWGTDQGAALSTAYEHFRNLGMIETPSNLDPHHIAGLLNFAGTGHEHVVVGTESYDISAGTVQRILDHISQNGDQGIFSANEILAGNVMGEAGQAVTQAGRDAIWPGWLLLAGGAGAAGAYGIDSARRGAELKATGKRLAQSASDIESSAGEGPFTEIGGFKTPPPPEPKKPEPGKDAESAPEKKGEVLEQVKMLAEIAKTSLEAQKRTLQERSKEIEKSQQIEGLLNNTDLLLLLNDIISKPEAERMGSLANAISRKRIEKGFAVSEIENKYPGIPNTQEEQEAKAKEYMLWDWNRAEEIMNKRAEIIKIQEQIAQIDKQIAQVDEAMKAGEKPAPASTETKEAEPSLESEDGAKLYLTKLNEKLQTATDKKLKITRKGSKDNPEKLFDGDNVKLVANITEIDLESLSIKLKIGQGAVAKEKTISGLDNIKKLVEAASNLNIS